MTTTTTTKTANVERKSNYCCGDGVAVDFWRWLLWRWRQRTRNLADRTRRHVHMTKALAIFCSIEKYCERSVRPSVHHQQNAWTRYTRAYTRAKLRFPVLVTRRFSLCQCLLGNAYILCYMYIYIYVCCVYKWAKMCVCMFNAAAAEASAAAVATRTSHASGDTVYLTH